MRPQDEDAQRLAPRPPCPRGMLRAAGRGEGPRRGDAGSGRGCALRGRGVGGKFPRCRRLERFRATWGVRVSGVTSGAFTAAGGEALGRAGVRLESVNLNAPRLSVGGVSRTPWLGSQGIFAASPSCFYA